MKTTRQRYTGEFKAKVALEAIRGDLTLAELAAKYGIHPTMIATWKRQAVEGMAATFSGASDAAKAAGDTEIEKLHAKIGQLVVERDLYESQPVNQGARLFSRDEASACAPGLKSIERVDHPGAGVRLAHQLISGSSMTACHNPTCTAQTIEGRLHTFCRHIRANRSLEFRHPTPGPGRGPNLLNLLGSGHGLNF